jgi:hypothetical protein
MAVGVCGGACPFCNQEAEREGERERERERERGKNQEKVSLMTLPQ